MHGKANAIPLAVALGLLGPATLARAQAPSYPDLYNPLNVFNFNLEMDPADWAAVQSDNTLDLEKPAFFSADGESKLLVSVRKKSLDALGNKISLKIDLNEYFDNNVWHGVKKLSLENGHQVDVVAEGIAWYMHRQAATLPGDDYRPGLASWVNVNVNGSPLGVYAHVEQVDKTFLRQRDLWKPGQTWLYKFSADVQTFEEGPTPSSPTLSALNYSPFIPGGSTPPAGYEAQLESLVDMKAMLTLGAVNAFTDNPDELFNKGKNFWFVDFEDGTKRHYLPWDLDAVLRDANASIYGSRNPYQTHIINNPFFRDDFNEIMLDLLNGPLSVSELTGFVDQLEPVLMPYLLTDPNTNLEDPEERFDQIRNWVTQRHASVLGQVQADMALGPAASIPEPGSAVLLALVGISYFTHQHRRRRAPACRSAEVPCVT